MSEAEGREPVRRWVRRESRRRAHRDRQQKHGASLRRVYADAIRKRRQEREKGRKA
jgi:hypothetical protein